jgi:hypothetical protein
MSTAEHTGGIGMTTVARLVAWGAMGVVLAVTLHYALFRMTLPIKPFIYQAF